MTKLFLSLYLFILVALAMIGWGGEWLWHKYQPANSQHQQILNGLENAWITSAQLASTWYQSTDTEQQSHVLTEIAEQLSIPVTLINKSDLANNVAQSIHTQTLVSYLSHNKVIIFQPLAEKSDKILELGPILLSIKESEADEKLKTALLFTSYLLLALFVALWIWPLWRDLRALERCSKQISKGRFDQSISIGPSSPVYFLAQAMHRMGNKIGELIEAQKMMLNAVSHDLRTPLSRLKFSLAVAGKTDQKESMQQDIKALEKLIDELLSFARFEYQNQHLQIESIPVEQVCLSVIENLQPTHIQIEFKCLLADQQLCLCDGFLFERLIQNLLSNAVKYAKSQIILELKIEDSTLIVIVDDDGCGIDKENWPYIFKPFYRIEKGQKNTHKGFGLGLAIVAKIAQWHRGSCHVEQAPLGGARFVVELRRVT